jgi:hypothetical protein
MRLVPFVLGLLVLSVPVSAQTVESYQIKYYNVGAPAPLQQGDVFLAPAAVCNQTPPATINTVNPTRVIWDDPANVGKVCVYAVPTGGTLPSLPVGTYEGTLTAFNSIGQAESARAPFSRLSGPAAPTGLRVIR